MTYTICKQPSHHGAFPVSLAPDLGDDGPLLSVCRTGPQPLPSTALPSRGRPAEGPFTGSRPAVVPAASPSPAFRRREAGTRRALLTGPGRAPGTAPKEGGRRRGGVCAGTGERESPVRSSAESLNSAGRAVSCVQDAGKMPKTVSVPQPLREGEPAVRPRISSRARLEEGWRSFGCPLRGAPGALLGWARPVPGGWATGALAEAAATDRP